MDYISVDKYFSDNSVYEVFASHRSLDIDLLVCYITYAGSIKSHGLSESGEGRNQIMSICISLLIFKIACDWHEVRL